MTYVSNAPYQLGSGTFASYGELRCVGGDVGVLLGQDNVASCEVGGVVRVRSGICGSGVKKLEV